MTREEILKLRQIAFRGFYSRPSFLFKRMLELRTTHDVLIAFQIIRSLFLWTKENIFSGENRLLGHDFMKEIDN
jgi:hypothetical protein